MSSDARWTDYLSAAIKTGGKLIPGVAQAIEVVESVENRRESVTRHEQTLAEMSRVEQSIRDVIEREMQAVLAKLHAPKITQQELEDEIGNLYAMRGYGREPFLAQGLLVNSERYEQLRAKPHLYGRVLKDHDVPSVDCFYMFVDSDRTRMLEVSPFALQQLLSGQSHGAPASQIVGGQDLFARRVATPADVSATPAIVAPEPRRILVPGGLGDAAWTPPPALAALHEEAVAGDAASMCGLGYALDRDNPECEHPDDAQSAVWYRRAAEAGDEEGMLNLGLMYEQGQGVGVDEAEAVRWYRRAADAGDARGMLKLGTMYENGKGVVKDEHEAAQRFRRAADAGSVRAMFKLGAMYFVGRGVGKDEAEAQRWFRRAGDAGDTAAMLNVCAMYANGQGVNKDDAEAARWARRAADAGNADGMSHLGERYEHGLGLDKDVAKAAEWYLRAAEKGHAEGLLNLCRTYQFGGYSDDDDAAVERLFRRAADEGDADAMCGLGRMCQAGVSVGELEAETEAARWYRRAADAGNTEGMSKLVALYEAEHGTDEDKAAAVASFRQAADAGHPVAMRSLGKMYESGHGVPVDKAEAARWFRCAAEAGDPDAMHELGSMLQAGRGVAKNVSEAARWYTRAADAGHVDGAGQLGLLYALGTTGFPADREKGLGLLREAAAAEGGDGWWTMCLKKVLEESP